MNISKRINVILFFFFFSWNMHAQGWVDVLRGVNDALSIANEQKKNSRASIRNSITNWGGCKGGALSNYMGTVALYGSNGYSYTAAIPERLKEVLREKHGAGCVFNDITITDGGSWLLIYNSDGYIGYGMPSGLKSAMDNLVDESIQSASFNDKNEWVLVTDENIYSFDSGVTRFFSSYEDVYGKLQTVNVFAGGAVACYKNGYTFYGRVPASVVNEISSFSHTPYVVKFDSSGSFLMCTKSGAYKYRLYDLGDINFNTVAWVSNTTPYREQAIPQTSNNSSVPYTTIPPAGGYGTTTSSKVMCSGCHGSGRCTACGGTGKQKSEAYYTGGGTIISDCPTCRGNGKCGVCYGKGSL